MTERVAFQRVRLSITLSATFTLNSELSPNLLDATTDFWKEQGVILNQHFKPQNADGETVGVGLKGEGGSLLGTSLAKYRKKVAVSFRFEEATHVTVRVKLPGAYAVSSDDENKANQILEDFEKRLLERSAHAQVNISDSAGTPAENVLGRPIEILLVESEPDILLTRKFLKETGISNHLSESTDGVEATFFLRRVGKYAESPRPDLILLSLTLPKKDGRLVLAEIKEDANLKHTPIAILTSSVAEEEFFKTYNMHANSLSYLTRPVDLEQFYKLLRAVENSRLKPLPEDPPTQKLHTPRSRVL